MKKKLIRFLVPVVGLAAILFTTGCETTEGFGRDVEDLGDNIEDASQDAQRR